MPNNDREAIELLAEFEKAQIEFDQTEASQFDTWQNNKTILLQDINFVAKLPYSTEGISKISNKKLKRARRRALARAEKKAKTSIDRNVPVQHSIRTKIIDGTVEARDYSNNFLLSQMNKDTLSMWCDGSYFSKGRRWGIGIVWKTDTPLLIEKGYTSKQYAFKGSEIVEMFAIYKTISIALGMVRTNSTENFKTIMIFSDSRACLDKLRSGEFHYWPDQDQIKSFALEIRAHIATLKKLSVNLQICWVPGHRGALGNIFADLKAREAAQIGGNSSGTRNISFKTPISTEEITNGTEEDNLCETFLHDTNLESIEASNKSGI